MLIDCLGKAVANTHKDIKRALMETDMVEVDGDDLSISNFFSESGDEINVYNGYCTEGPAVFEVDEIDEAIRTFMEMIEEDD